VYAALEGDAHIEAIYLDEAFSQSSENVSLVKKASSKGIALYSLATGVLQKVTDAVSPQPIVAEVRLPLQQLGDVKPEGCIFVLHGIKDPGNLGTIIRSADAAGVNAVILTGNCVDPFNPKSLRATAGSIFHVPVVVDDYETVLQFLSSHGVQTLATVVRGGTSHRSVDFTKPTAVVIGSESHGLSEEESSQCSGAITIPMVGKSESLNAGVAAALLAFESLYQREGHSQG
jgi:RNA methyltransferase, TrmH family